MGRSAAPPPPGQSGRAGWPCGGQVRAPASAPQRPQPSQRCPPLLPRRRRGTPPVPGGRQGVRAVPPRGAPVAGGSFIPQAPPGAPSWRRRRDAAPHLGAAPVGPRCRGRRGGRAGPPDLPCAPAAHLPRPAGNKGRRRAAALGGLSRVAPLVGAGVCRPCIRLSAAARGGLAG